MKTYETAAKTVSAEHKVSNTAGYLRQCRVRWAQEEKARVHVPPTDEETQTLLQYLTSKGVAPVVVGSVGIFYHIGGESHKFRPTVDLDIFVHRKLPRPPTGWARDMESPGVESWISPSGGYVDFLVSGTSLASGEKMPKSVETDPGSPTFPVATALDLFKLKLDSMRDKDLLDVVQLARSVGVPDKAQMGKMTQTQKDNYAMVKKWMELRPQGAYGS